MIEHLSQIPEFQSVLPACKSSPREWEVFIGYLADLIADEIIMNLDHNCRSSEACENQLSTERED